jgi:hypothetical protein
LPYDIDDIYAFWCSNYRDMTFNEFLHIRLSEFNRKMKRIPESEPLYKIIQSRVINIGKIKDKEQKKHYKRLQREFALPDNRTTEEKEQDFANALW